jgi:hypothetical protein
VGEPQPTSPTRPPASSLSIAQVDAVRYCRRSRSGFAPEDEGMAYADALYATVRFIDGTASIWHPPAPGEDERTIGWAACSS